MHLQRIALTYVYPLLQRKDCELNLRIVGPIWRSLRLPFSVASVASELHVRGASRLARAPDEDDQFGVVSKYVELSVCMGKEKGTDVTGMQGDMLACVCGK